MRAGLWSKSERREDIGGEEVLDRDVVRPVLRDSVNAGLGKREVSQVIHGGRQIAKVKQESANRVPVRD